MTNVKTGLYAPRPCRWVVQGSDRKQAGLITKMCYPYVDNQNCEIPVFYQTRQKEPLVLRVSQKFINLAMRKLLRTLETVISPKGVNC